MANTSQHLRVLARAGVATSRRDGNRVLYRLAGGRVEALWEALRAVATEHVAGLDRLAADYLGDRNGLEQVGRWELAPRLDDDDGLVVWDVRPPAEFAAGHVRVPCRYRPPRSAGGSRSARRYGCRRLLPWPVLRLCG